MTPKQIRDARAKLGAMWGKGRPLYAAELARSLRLTGEKPGKTVLQWENGQRAISGPVSCCIEMYLRGDMPPDGIPQGGRWPED